MIKLSTLVEMLPNKVFQTPTGILVASQGPNVEDCDKRLVIPANKFHAIQIGTNASINLGASYPLNELSGKDRSDQVNLVLTELSIPNVRAQGIKTVRQYVKGFTTNCEGGFTAEMGTDFLSILAKDEPSKHYMNAQVPNRAPPKGKGKGKDKSKDDSATPVTEGLALHTPIFFPEDPYLQPEIPLYSPQQYWEDSVNRHFLPPDFRDHSKIRCAYNTDSIQYLYDGKIRHPTPKGQNPTLAGVLDVSPILRTSPNCRGRNGGVLQHVKPFFQHSNSELVQFNTSNVYTPA